MQPSRKSLFMLLSMLLVGAALGAAGMASFGPRPGPPRSAGGPEGGPQGFVAHMERTIQPRDSAQRAAIMPILEATDQRNRETVDETKRVMRENLVSMQSALAPLLEPAQRERLDELLKTLGRPPQGGPPGRGPPPGGPRPDGPRGNGPPFGGPPPGGPPPGESLPGGSPSAPPSGSPTRPPQ